MSIPAAFSWSVPKVQGQTLTVTATEWNAFTAKINEWRNYLSIPTASFTHVIGGITDISADIFNEAVGTINLMTTTVAQVPKGQIITAAIFNQIVTDLNNTPPNPCDLLCQGCLGQVCQTACQNCQTCQNCNTCQCSPMSNQCDACQSACQCGTMNNQCVTCDTCQCAIQGVQGCTCSIQGGQCTYCDTCECLNQNNQCTCATQGCQSCDTCQGSCEIACNVGCQVSCQGMSECG